MNQTQRKYVLERLRSNLVEKLNALVEENDVVNARYNTCNKIMGQTIYKALATNKLIPKKLSAKDMKESALPRYYNLIDFFDLDDLQDNTYKTLVKKYGKPSGHYDTYVVELPTLRVNDYTSSFRFSFSCFLDRAQKIKEYWKKIQDEMMLGDTEEALALITEVENMKF